MLQLPTNILSLFIDGLNLESKEIKKVKNIEQGEYAALLHFGSSLFELFHNL